MQNNRKLSVQLLSRMRDLGAATYCTLFLPEESDTVKEMQDAGRVHSELETNHPGKERGSPHIWFFAAMQKAIEETLAQKAGNAPDLRKAEALKILRTTIENTKFIELNTWVKARRHLPTHAKTSQVADHLRRRRFLLPTSGSSSKERVISTSVYTAGRGHGSAGRAPEEEDKHRRLDQARHAALRSRRTAGENSTWKHGEGGKAVSSETGKRQGYEGPRRPRLKWPVKPSRAKSTEKIEEQETECR